MSNVTEFISIEPNANGKHQVVTFEGFVATDAGTTEVMVSYDGFGFQMEASEFFGQYKLNIDYDKAQDKRESVMFMCDHMVTAA